MSIFEAFQQTTATMKKVSQDGFGDESVDTSFTVDVDPTWEHKRVVNDDNEEVTARGTIFVSDHDSIDHTHKNWRIEIDGEEWNVEVIKRVVKIGTDKTSHYELMVR